MLIIAQLLKENWFKNHGFCSFTNNKLVNEAAKDSAPVGRQECKIPPAFGTNQIVGFGGYCPLISLEKN